MQSHLGVLIGDASTLQPKVHLTKEQRDYTTSKVDLNMSLVILHHDSPWR